MVEDVVAQTMYRILRSSLMTDEPVEVGDWEPVFEEMKAQSVAALPGEWLKRHPIEGAYEWVRFCAAEQARWVRVMYAQADLLALLERGGIPCVIIKGAAAAMAYPCPRFRSMGDVDFLVKRTDYEKTAKLLEESGYDLTHDKNPAMHHYGYSKGGVSFELHRRLAGVRESEESMLALFESGIDNRHLAEIEGLVFPVLPVGLNGLVLALHMKQHLIDGIGLRHIVDWMMYVDGLSESVWADKVLPLLREAGVGTLALTATAACQKYLGLRAIVKNVEPFPCDEFISYILEEGNFGRKSGTGGHSASFIAYVRSFPTFFRRLQSGGMGRWAAARRHKALRPFAWLYQLGRIVGLLLAGKESPYEVLAQRERGLARRELLDSLGLRYD